MPTTPRFKANNRESVRINLPIDEYEILTDLVVGLSSVLQRTDPTGPLDPFIDRLFPPFFEDPLEELAYEHHNAEFIATRHLKLNRFARVQETLAQPHHQVGQWWRTEVSFEELEIWMFVFQDIRLAVSRMANIQTEDDVDLLSADMASLMHWLGYMLDEIVHIFLRAD